jgi:hydroxymethylglutaryl-CoA lyase
LNLPVRATLVEVGPRDGLQSLARVYPVEVKVELIALLARSGLPKIEITSFVRADVVPQLADAEELVARLPRVPGCAYRALVPNRRGAERAAAAGVDEVLALTTASETYNRKNQNMSVEESVAAATEIAGVAHAAGLAVTAAIGLALWCPYEGEIPPERVLGIVERLRGAGIDSVYVSTSAGVDGPRAVHDLCARILDRFPGLELGVHLHNTNGMALANALAALDAGATVLEGSVCGLGGGLAMPAGMAPFGNVATEDLAQMLEELGVETGVDCGVLLEGARRIAELLDLGETHSYALRGGTKADVSAAATS